MKFFLKLLAITLGLLIVFGLGEMWFNSFIMGRYWSHAPIYATIAVGFLYPTLLISLLVLYIKSVIKF